MQKIEESGCEDSLTKFLHQFEVFDRGLRPPDGLDNVLSAMLSFVLLVMKIVLMSVDTIADNLLSLEVP